MQRVQLGNLFGLPGLPYGDWQRRTLENGAIQVARLSQDPWEKKSENWRKRVVSICHESP